MFDTRQFDKISPQYFNIILLSKHDVTIQSRNTGHYWYLHNTDYPAEGYAKARQSINAEINALKEEEKRRCI